MSLKIGVSGIRGIIGESLTEEVISDFAKAFGTFVKDVQGDRREVIGKGKSFYHAPCTMHQAPSILIGRDTRASGEFVRKIVAEGLLATGCSVTDFGLAPTPTMLFAVRHFKADGAIIITASHNPGQWNGLKFVRPDGTFLTKDEADKLIAVYSSKKFILPANIKDGKILIKNEAITAHLDAVIKAVDAKVIKEAGFKVAVDYCNGTGAVTTKYLLDKLGCRTAAINVSPDGKFTHNPEPTAANLAQLCEFVKKEKADIGFAQDPDADRLAVVSEKGIAIGEENTLALAVKYVLTKNVGAGPCARPTCRKSGQTRGSAPTVVVNLSTSRMIDDICREFGAELYRSAVGETNVVDKMRQVGAIVGGEGNGGVIYPSVNFGRDSFIGMALILEYMAKSKKRLSELVAGIKQYYIENIKIDCPQEKIAEILDKVNSRGVLQYAPTSINTLDGVKIDFADGWVHVRGSNTEPIIRIMAEAPTSEKAKEYIKKIIDCVKCNV